VLKASLRWDKRKDGSHGRALTIDFPALGLPAGDRLEPCRALMDVGKFEDVDQFPFTCTFWRPSAETRVRHRNPLMDGSIGVSHDATCPDKLHCLYLGPMFEWNHQVIWVMIEADVYSVANGRDKEERNQLSVQMLRAELMAWYKLQRRTSAKPLSEFGDLTLNMLNTKASCTMTAHAVETRHLMPFLLLSLEKYKVRIGEVVSGKLQAAGKALVSLDELFMRMGPQTSPDQIAEGYVHYKRFMQ
jgi:hypothetical protein